MKILNSAVRWYQSSLRHRIIGLGLLLSLGSLAIVTLVSFSAILGQLRRFSDRLQEAENALRSDVVGRNLASSAVDSAADIDSFFLERIEDIRRWSEEPLIVSTARLGTQTADETGMALLANDPVVLSTRLGESLVLPIESETFSQALSFVFQQTERVETTFVEIIITDAHGINLLLTRRVDQRTQAGEAWWQEAVAPSLAGIGITQAHIDPGTQKPVVGIALPIVDNDTKEIIGVIRALVDLTSLQRRLSQKSIRFEADIQLISPDGQLIAETASDHSAERILNPAVNLLNQGDEPTLAIQSAKPGADSAGFIMVNSPKGAQIVGYALSSGSDFYDNPAQLSGFSGFHWGLTVSQPEARATRVLSSLIETGQAFERLPGQLGTTFGLLTILVAIAAIGGAVLVSSTITRSLVELNRMSRKVQDGDLTAQVEVRSTDEVGQLSHAFNLMTDGLRQREKERDIFGRVVSPEVREKLLDGNLELGGETRWVSVIFSDIRDFSAISEKLSPQEVVTFLNEYLGEMSDAILPWGGYINNFIGDAIVAIFGAPIDHPDKTWRAVAAAISMRERLQILNERRIARGEQPIQSGIGISTGEAVAGQIGSLERLLYTVIGDAVNVAARLETLTKDFPEHAILMNRQTAETILQHPEVTLKPLGPMQVKGRTEPVDVYAVVSWNLPLSDG